MVQKNEIKRINDLLAEGIRLRTNDKTLNDLLGLTDQANGALGDLLGTFTNAQNLKLLLGDLSSTKKLGDIIGNFDEGTDPQGDIYQALGVGTTNSINDAVQYIHHVALGTPQAYSVADILKVSGTEKLKDFIAKTGGTQINVAGGKSILDAIGHDGVADLDSGVMGQLEDYVTGDADSIYGRLGAFTGPVGGALQDDNVKASLDLAHIDLDALLAALYDGSIKNVMINRDMPYLTEFWATEQLDATKWEEILDGAGTGVFAVDDGYMFYDLDTGVAADNDVLLNSKYRWQARPATFSDTNTCIEKLVLEFEARVTGTLTDIANANFVMGFAETKDNDNTDNNLAVFTMDGSDNFIARTDDDGAADQDSSTITVTLGDWNKFRIEVYDTGYKFYLNEALVATNETAVPDEAMYLVFGIRREAGGVVGLNITNIRCQYEEVV